MSKLSNFRKALARGIEIELQKSNTPHTTREMADKLAVSFGELYQHYTKSTRKEFKQFKQLERQKEQQWKKFVKCKPNIWFSQEKEVVQVREEWLRLRDLWREKEKQAMNLVADLYYPCHIADIRKADVQMNNYNAWFSWGDRITAHMKGATEHSSKFFMIKYGNRWYIHSIQDLEREKKRNFEQILVGCSATNC